MPAQANTTDATLAPALSRAAAGNKIPILFLKTENRPEDVYRKHFSTEELSTKYEHEFVRIISQIPVEGSVEELKQHILSSRFEDAIFSNGQHDEGYGGLIFTSARAAEVFVDTVLDLGEFGMNNFNIQDMPMYCVGEATAKPLDSMEFSGPEVRGTRSGKAENLAHFILGDYPRLCEKKSWSCMPPLLFLSGETRKDAIPRILDDPNYHQEDRIRVDILPMYSTIPREEFCGEFWHLMKHIVPITRLQWLVIFSRQGVKNLLHGLSRLDFNDRDRGRELSRAPNSYIATIGPETAKDLEAEYGCKPEAVAQRPNPAALCSAIEAYMRVNGLTA